MELKLKERRRRRRKQSFRERRQALLSAADHSDNINDRKAPPPGNPIYAAQVHLAFYGNVSHLKREVEEIWHAHMSAAGEEIPRKGRKTVWCRGTVDCPALQFQCMRVVSHFGIIAASKTVAKSWEK